MKQLKPIRMLEPDWGVAGYVPTAELTALAPRDPNQWNVFTSDADFSVLLVAGVFDADHAAQRLALNHERTYSLDFDDEAPSVHEYSPGKNGSRVEVHPATFLKSHGIVAPGYEPLSPSPVRTVSIVFDSTPDEVRERAKLRNALLESHPLGTLIRTPDMIDEDDITAATGHRIISLSYSTRTKEYFAFTYEPKKRATLFRSKPMAIEDDFPIVDSVLGATKLIDICRVLSIPPAYLDISA